MLDSYDFEQLSDNEINNLVSKMIFGKKHFIVDFCNDYSLLKFLYPELASEHCCIHIFSDHDYIHDVKLIESGSDKHEYYICARSESLPKALSIALLMARGLLKKKKKKKK